MRRTVLRFLTRGFPMLSAIGALLAFATPADANKCGAAKLKATGKKAAAKLGCHAKAVGKGIPVDAPCLDKAEAKFTDAFAKSLEADGHDCVDEVQATIRDTANTDMDVDDVTVTGDRATAKVSQGKATATFELERSGDTWQISSLGGGGAS